MLLFGHVGLTLAASAILCQTANRLHSGRAGSGALPDRQDSPELRSSWLSALRSPEQAKFLVIGSLLPDIIDKPLYLLLRDTIGSGRVYAHTLLFLVVLAVASMFLWRRHGKAWLAALSFGTFMHLVLDQLWLSPGTLLWPFYGLAFPRLPEDYNLVQGLLNALLTNPAVYIPEAAGFVLFLWFAIPVLRKE